MIKDIKYIAFDADDTLWDCQGHFERVMQELYTLLEPWVDRQTAARELFATERKNMTLLGYGTKAFTLSMIETALRVSHHKMSGDRLAWIQRECYTLLELPATPLPEVRETLDELSRQGWHMAVFTKGELLDQENKLRRSGLLKYFDDVEITSDKGQAEFLALCEHQQCHPSELLMVGNSLKSDIAPALAVGAWAIHIPFHVTWQLETVEEFEHPQMQKISQFSDLLRFVNAGSAAWKVEYD